MRRYRESRIHPCLYAAFIIYCR